MHDLSRFEMFLCEFNIDVEQWRNRRANTVKPKKPKQEEEGAEEQDVFCRTDGKITPHSRKNLFVFKQPSPGTTLNGDDFDNFLDQQNASKGWEYLDPHLQCNIDVQQYDIVTGRKTLVRLGSALYERRESFELNAVRLGTRPTLFMSTNCSEESKQTGMQHYWAARFEALCTKRKVVDTESCFYSILKRKIGRHQVLFYAEIDCKLKTKTKSQKPMSNYVELKCRQHVPENNYNRFMQRYLEYWLQSHLANVPTIVEGVRDHTGKLVHVERFETEKLPEICKEQRKVLGKGWNSKKVLDFLEFVLNKISDACERNAGVTVRVKYDAKKKVISANLIPEDKFVQKVQGALSRSKSKVKLPRNMLLKSEEPSMRMKRGKTTAKPRRTPHDDDTDQVVEEACSDRKLSPDYLEAALNEISDVYDRNVSFTIRVKFDAKEKVLTAKLLAEDEFIELVQNALSSSKSKPKPPNDKSLQSEITSMNIELETAMTMPGRTQRDDEVGQPVEDEYSDSKPAQNPQESPISTRVSSLYNRISLRLYSLVAVIRRQLEHWPRMKRAVDNWIPARD